ncbi:MAG TPA: hypothetical protein VGX50_20320 [Longimicrobium sp.]|jgi:hypothetical protein|nr:hypothetical protein [Longimicrobium sp.]
MPISYTIDEEKGFITEVWTGDIAASDLASYWRRCLADPQVLSIRKTLVDLRECRILFKGVELSAMIKAIVIPVLDGRDWKTAIVVAHPVQFGVSRQYQAFAESYSRDAIFSDPEDARRWLLA